MYRLVTVNEGVGFGDEGLAGEVVADVLAKLAGGLVAAFGFFGDGGEQEGGQLAVDAVGGEGVVLDDAADDLGGGAGVVEREVAGEQPVEHDADGVDVGAYVDVGGGSGGLLG